jgi:hypothetical protein
MASENIVFIGGIYNLLFAFFHLMFWKLFGWKEDLAKLTFINRQVMQILNLCLTFVFLLFSYISFIHTSEMLTTSLGRILLLLISIFWLLRAIEQVFFFGLKNRGSIAFFVIFLLGTMIYLYAFTIGLNNGGSTLESMTVR